MNNKLMVICLKNFYQTQLLSSSPNKFVMIEADGETLLVDTPAQATLMSKEQALELVSKLDDEKYVCSNGESGRPKYVAISEANANAIFGAAINDDYPWEDCMCEGEHVEHACGECNVCGRYRWECDRLRYEADAIKQATS